MGRKAFRIATAVAALALTAGTVQAAPSCWQAHDVAAARVRQMQTMLMVATLRCRAAHIDIADSYNGFVAAEGPALADANLAIKQHFAAAGGDQADYDRFTTALANAYGAAATDETSCADAVATAHEAMAPGALERVAAARLFPAALPGGRCDAPPAVANAPAPTLPPILALAAPAPLAPAAQPVTLPTDVIAALAVMARFHDMQMAPPPTAAAPTRVAAIGG